MLFFAGLSWMCDALEVRVGWLAGAGWLEAVVDDMIEVVSRRLRDCRAELSLLSSQNQQPLRR